MKAYSEVQKRSELNGHVVEQNIKHDVAGEEQPFFRLAFVRKQFGVLDFCQPFLKCLIVQFEVDSSSVCYHTFYQKTF